MIQEVQAVMVSPGDIIAIDPNFKARHRKEDLEMGTRLRVIETRTTMFHNVRITLDNGTTYTFQPGDILEVEF
jgi:hypothetical protein